jgi:hypothetical protein
LFRDIPRISVDIDLVYIPLGERDLSLREISATIVRISHDVESRIPRTKFFFKKIKGTENNLNYESDLDIPMKLWVFRDHHAFYPISFTVFGKTKVV